jgi:hypothetical protein
MLPTGYQDVFAVHPPGSQSCSVPPTRFSAPYLDRGSTSGSKYATSLRTRETCVIFNQNTKIMLKRGSSVVLVCLAILLPTLLSAQAPRDAAVAKRLELEQYLRTKDNFDPAEAQRREQAEWIKSDFVRQANSFAILWAQFAAQSNSDHTIDIKLAKKLSKSFHSLESARGWPAK